MARLGKRMDAQRHHQIKLVACVSGTPLTPTELTVVSNEVSDAIARALDGSGEFISLGATQELDVNGEET